MRYLANINYTGTKLTFSVIKDALLTIFNSSVATFANMTSLKTTDPLALSLLFSDELYRVDDKKTPVELLTEVEDGQMVSPTTERKEEVKSSNFDYLGENNKYTLLIFNEPDETYISPNNLEALKNILVAKKQELRDVAILNLANYPETDYRQLKDFFACNKVVLFGINPKKIGLPDMPGNTITSIDTLKVFATYSFEEMLIDATKKRVFWNEMKLL